MWQTICNILVGLGILAGFGILIYVYSKLSGKYPEVKEIANIVLLFGLILIALLMVSYVIGDVICMHIGWCK